jgi:ABC-type uncharacterized transport system involved in gliding motility auxiliary subunit
MEHIKKFFGSAGKNLSGHLQSRNGNLLLTVFIIILINVVGLFLYFRMDLTLNDSYSLSSASKEVVNSLEEPLTVKVFFSKDLPAPYNSVYRYVQDLMSEYKLSGGRNFRYEMVDMEDEKNKSVASGYGINQVQVNEVASDQMKSRAVFMGLVIIHGDMVERIGEITSSDGLEFKITGAIRKMTGKSDALLSLKDPVSVTFYASGDLKGFKIQGFDTIESTVKTIVDKVNVQNYRKLRYTFVDPSLDKSVQTIAAKYGMQRIQWKEEVTPDGKHLPAGEGILSIVIESSGRFQVVPLQISQTIFGRFVITGIESLDEKINNGLSILLSKHAVVGYATGHGEKSLEDEREGSANLKKYLSSSYDLKEIDLTKEEISDSIGTLIINGPKSKFTDEELYAIDQFIMKGGNILFMVDSFNEMRMQGGSPYAQSAFLPVDTGLEKFFSSWGVTIGKDYILDKKCYIQRQGQGGSMPIYFIPMIERKTLSHSNPVTKTLKNIIVVKGSSITLNNDLIKRVGLSSDTLISSSKESWKMQGQINLIPFMIQPPDEKSLSSYPLAVSLAGKFRSVFAGEKPVSSDPKKAAEAKKDSLSGPGIKESAKAGRVVIIGTSEMAGGPAIDAEGKSPDAAFIANAIDWIGGDDKTPEMRSKGLDYNPIDSTNEYTRLLIKILNVALLPVFVVIAGIIVWRRRTIRRNAIRAQFTKEA